jgi:quercetin dioxygenase-like cupin family protein
MKMTRESRSFRIYETELSASSGAPHSHPVPAVVVLVSGEANTGKKHLDKPGGWVYISAGEQHQIEAPRNAKLVEIEAR